MKKKNIIIISSIVILILAGIIISLSYASKAGKSRQAVVETADEEKEESRSEVQVGREDEVQEEQEEELESSLPEATDSAPVKGSFSCFTYEKLPDGTLRITGYDEEKNTQNPYQVTIPSTIDGKQVSTLGKECLGAP